MTLEHPSAPDSRDADELQLPREVTGRLAFPPLAPAPATQIVAHSPQGGFAQATRLLLARYGAEIRGFLRSRTSSRVSMDEVYSVFTEDVWKGLPALRAEGQVRSWLYTIARNALSRHIRFKQRWRSRYVSAELDELDSELRRSLPTQLGDRAEAQQWLSALSAADRSLIEQRLLFSMPWRDIAQQGVCAHAADREAELEKVSARLRKRYQLLVQQLREHAAAARESKA